MRELPRDPERLKHVLQAIERIEEYTQGTTAESLDADLMRKHATAYNIQIIGEAIYKISKEFKEAHPTTPWAVIEKMRHILVHDYYQVNMRIMWLVITEDLKPLKEQITEYIKEFEE